MAAELEYKAASGRILVVEDEGLIRWLIAEELRSSGVQVIEAGSAPEAIAYLASDHNVDLVFSDITMPGGIDGIDLVERISELYPWLLVVLTSGNPPLERLPKHIKLIPKPYSPVDVAADLICAVDVRRDARAG